MTDKKNMNVDTENKEINDNSDFSVGNIFEDFESNEELEQEINKNEAEINKDTFYYIGLGSNFLKILNFILFVVIAIFFSYIKIQNIKYSSEILNPVCSLLLGTDISYETLPKSGEENIFNSCMTLSLAIDNVKKAMDNDSKNIYTKLSKIVTDFYTMKDFINSKEVVFLLNASENKKDPLDLLVKFDKAKNDFLVSDKLKIQCSKILVTDTELEAECNAYSSLWDTSIPGYDGEKSQNNLKGGTSISIASSFLNFLEKQGDFMLLEKQKVFKIQDVTGEGGYSFKTPFKVYLSKRDLKLK